MKYLPLLTAIILLTNCTSNSGRIEYVVNQTAQDRINATLGAFVDSNRVAGAAALIYEKGEEVYYGAFGDADRADGTTMQRNTIVQIYSMTKPITGVALMQLYEQGMFGLDDPLHKFIPEFANLVVYEGESEQGNPILSKPNRPITIRDITRHTAGFASNTNAPYTGALLAEANLFNFENSLEDVILGLAKIPLEFQPGDEWNYGPSVDVQAYLVQKLSGQPFEEYIKENIFTPLGMNETRYLIPESELARLSSVYSTDGDGNLFQIPDSQAHELNVNPHPLRPGGWGLTSTLDDYMTFARMLVNKGTLNGTQILKAETVELMSTNQLSDDVTERQWLPSKGQVGFGIDFAVRVAEPQSADENMGVKGEFFWDGLASTLFWVDPANDLTAVFYVQKYPFDGNLHKDFRDAVYGKFIEN